MYQAEHTEFTPFVAVRHNRLVTIIAQTRGGLYRDRQGLLHPPEHLDRDLDAYAERVRADLQDLHNTQDDATW